MSDPLSPTPPSFESAEGLRLVLDAIQDFAVFTVDAAGCVRSWNLGAEKIFGWSAAEIVGEAAAVLWTPEDRAAGTLLREIQAAREHGAADTAGWHVRKDGRRFFSVGTLRPVRAADGAILGYTKVCRDATGQPDTAVAGTSLDAATQKQAAGALRESQRRFELTVEGAKLGTFHWDGDRTRLNWNARLKEMFWFPPDAEITLADAQSRMHPLDRPRVVAAMERAVRGEERYDVEYRVVGPGGELRWLHVIGEASQNAAGVYEHFTGLAMDVTSAKLAEQEREALLDAERAARSSAEGASRMKDEFLATLSHELRTPLNAILGWAEVLHEGPNTPEDLQSGLAIIQRNARSQKQIIEDLLDMSRIISGKVRLDVQLVDLKPTVEAAIETVQAAADAKGIRLQPVLDPQARPVSGDPNRLQQVFWNLLSNAIKFTPKGGRVQVILERVHSHLEVRISDTGPGIAAEFLPHVFDRFRQADSSITRHPINQD